MRSGIITEKEAEPVQNLLNLQLGKVLLGIVQRITKVHYINQKLSFKIESVPRDKAGALF